MAGEGGKLGSHSPLQDSFNGCLGVMGRGHRRWGSRLLFCWCTCQKFQQPALLLLLQRNQMKYGWWADIPTPFVFLCVAKLPWLEAEPSRAWAFGNQDPTKIPPHPTGFQLVQQSKDLTYYKDYLSFQVHPGSDHVPFKRNSAVTVGQQRYKLLMQRKQQLSAALSLPGESCPQQRNSSKVTSQALWLKTSSGKHKGLRRDIRSQSISREALVIPALFTTWCRFTVGRMGTGHGYNGLIFLSITCCPSYPASHTCTYSHLPPRSGSLLLVC